MHLSPLSLALSARRGGYKPSLGLRFAGASALDPRISFTRASAAWDVGSNGLIQQFASNAPRFAYDPVTLAPLGLRVEEARTNLIRYSQDLPNAGGWNNASAPTVTGNASTAPDGTVTATRITSVAQDGRYQAPLVASGTVYTASCFVKYVSGSNGAMVGNDAGNFYAIYNTQTGALLSLGASATSSGSQYFGNGWYRIWVTWTSNVSTNIGLVAYNNAAGAVDWWGYQLEAGSSPSTYIPTTSATVTRAQDVARVTPVPWANVNEGTVVCAFRLMGSTPSGIGGVFSIDDDTINNRFDYRVEQGLMAVTQAGSGDNASSIPAPSIGARAVIAQAYGAGQLAKQYRGGVLTGFNASPTIHPAVLSYLNLGAIAATLSPGLLVIESFAYYPKRLPDAVLQAMTA